MRSITYSDVDDIETTVNFYLTANDTQLTIWNSTKEGDECVFISKKDVESLIKELSELHKLMKDE